MNEVIQAKVLDLVGALRQWGVERSLKDMFIFSKLLSGDDINTRSNGEINPSSAVTDDDIDVPPYNYTEVLRAFARL